LLVVFGVLAIAAVWRYASHRPQAYSIEAAQQTQPAVQEPPPQPPAPLQTTESQPAPVLQTVESQPAPETPQLPRAPSRSQRGPGSRWTFARQILESTYGPEPNQPAEPNEPLEAVNLNNVEMKNIFEKLAEWTAAKAIIPTSDEVLRQRITVYSTRKLPRSQAVNLIYAALRSKGFVAVPTDDVIYIKPIKDARIGLVPTISDQQPLAALENKNQVVQKFFKLQNYSASRLQEIILPLIGEYGYVSADQNTGTVLVIDTVENLLRIERIVQYFDVPESGPTVTEIFQIQQGDPSEIVQVLKLLLGDETDRRGGGRGRDRGTSGGGRNPAASAPAPAGPEARSAAKPGESTAAVSVLVTVADSPVVLIPEPKRNWIIARASPEGMKEIAAWIKKLDRLEPVQPESETISITYADVGEVADQIDRALQELPGRDIKPSVLVRPLRQSRQIMLFGRAELREMVKKLIAEIDIPAGEFQTRAFKLNHADPEQVKSNLEELYSQGGLTAGRFNPFSFSRQSVSQPSTSEMVRVIAFPALQQVTVIASAENMAKIEKQLEEWDKPLDVEQVKPLIIELHNSDPMKMADLLSTLFSTDETNQSNWPFSLFMGGRSSETRKKIVGPLYGLLTFKAVPGTKKIIVISKIPEAYAVVGQFVRDLDKEEMAEVPKVITLKYADPEELCERLNATFNEPGTTVSIRLGERGLSAYSMAESANQQSTTNTATNKETTSQGEYKPWWGTGFRGKTDEMPISNVIGRIRFIPDRRSKAVLVLAPPEFMESVEQIIKQLDTPGRQVMIKAIIVEVDHSNVTSLGLQLTSNPDAFGALGENEITALSQLKLLEERGSFTLSAPTNITALIDFLVKKVNAKILNQQTLWTKDNEEAEFFKGNKVAFIKGSQTSTEARSVTQNYEFERVGMTLRARPSITPEKNVDVTVNVIISQLTSERVNSQPVRTEMDTTTNMIVRDGQTILLGGILFQEDSQIERKLPLLGDLPVLGSLLRHKETILANNEMLVFITPYVIDDPTTMHPEAIEQLSQSQQKLRVIQQQLDKWLQENNAQTCTPAPDQQHRP
jgi:type II secretory pathway component GspD/PulD (secretin)